LGSIAKQAPNEKKLNFNTHAPLNQQYSRKRTNRTPAISRSKEQRD
jgi:hypothetical protein